MNDIIAQGEHIPFSLIERNPALSVIPVTVSFSYSDRDSITAVLDAVPAPETSASGYFVGGQKLQNNVTITATARQSDGQSRSAKYIFDVVPPAVETSSLALHIGKPVLPADAPIAPRPAFTTLRDPAPVVLYNDHYPNVAPHNARAVL